MYCGHCGAENQDTARFCQACHKPALVAGFSGAAQTSTLPSGRTADVAKVPAITRPGVITLLAVLQFISAGVLLLIGVGLAFVAMTDSSQPVDPRVGLIAALSLAFAAYQFICGYGLFRLRQYGRVMEIISAIVGLLAFPIGTLISIAILLYLNKPGVKVLFLGKTPDELSPAEIEQLSTLLSDGALAAAIIVVAVVIIAIVAIGLVAAIAVPGILRARMAGNEAVAIGSLRAVSSAQSTFAASCANGLYARTLNTLGSGPSGGSAFISPDLSAAATVTKSGYTVTMRGTAATGAACNGASNLASDFCAWAIPISNATGSRMFCVDQSGTLREAPVSVGISNVTANAGCPITWSPLQ